MCAAVTGMSAFETDDDAGTCFPTKFVGAMQISESFRRFGVSASVKALLVARFDATSADVRPANDSELQGLRISILRASRWKCLQADAVKSLIHGEQAGIGHSAVSG